MRLALLAIAASLALAGCGKKQTTANTNAIDQAVSAEDFSTNDATAIDAATGADANMAADVDINMIGNGGNDSGDSASDRSASRRRASPVGGGTASDSNAAAPVPEPATQPAESNSD